MAFTPTNYAERMANREPELTDEEKRKKTQEEVDKNLSADMDKGEQFADRMLGEDFALSRLSDQEEIQNVRGGLNENVNMSDEERIARQETAYGALSSSEGTQNRQMLRGLAAAGVRGGAAAGAIGDMANQQAMGRRDIAQKLFVEEQNLNRQGLRDLATFETNVQQYDLGQENAELSTRLQTALSGMSMYSNERSAIRQQEAALAAANAQKGGKK